VTRRPRRRGHLRAATTLAALLAAAALAGVAFLGWTLQVPYAGWSGPEAVVTLPRGTPAAAMVDRLAGAGVVRYPAVLQGWISLTGAAGRLRAGTYRFDRPLSPLEILRKIEAGEVMVQAVTIPEGLDFEEIASRLAEAGFGTEEAFLRCFRDPTAVRDLDPAAPDLEGYLFPDTYHFPVGETPARITEAMVRRFRHVASPSLREEAARHGITLRQAVTLASLIEEETSVPAERPRISRVFHNRLTAGMRLECDPTVSYGLRRQGVTVSRLLYKHLREDTPWNTYLHAGLPPGPICNPGRASLEAAVRPEGGEELYFVASPEGGHRFSRDLATHVRAVAQWRAYVRSR
jgi:UPF0755 protein